MLEKEDKPDFEVYNFKDSGYGKSWMIGNDTFINANAYINGIDACPVDIIVPRSLTNEKGETRPVQVVGIYAYSFCGSTGYGEKTKTVLVTKQVKIIKYLGFGSMTDVESFRIEEGSVLQLIDVYGLHNIGWTTGRNDAEKRGTLVLPPTLYSVDSDGIYECNLFKVIIYCGAYSLTQKCKLQSYNMKEMTTVNVTNYYGPDTRLFGHIPDRSNEVEEEAEAQCYSAGFRMGFQINVSDSGCTIFGWTDGVGSRCPENLSIPEMVGDFPVLAVGERAFENCTTTRGVIFLPQTLKKIEMRAFANTTGVTGVILPGMSKLEKIGKRAFWRCGLEAKQSFPLSLSANQNLTIGDEAFSEAGVEDLIFLD